LINYEKKIDNSCRKWKEQASYPTTCQPTEGTGEGSAYASRHKSWQVLSIALAFCCLERSNLSPLKRMIVSKDWIAVANRLVPVLGAGTMTLPKYRLSGSEVSEMAEYKYPDPSCASFVQFG